MKNTHQIFSKLKLITLASFFSLSFQTLALNESHAIAMHGDIKYPANFKHFDYSDPSAAKFGRIKLASQGTFDSLNPFIAKGAVADRISLIYDTLTVASLDEPFTQYGLIAERIIWPDDRSYVEYKLNPNFSVIGNVDESGQVQMKFRVRRVY